jgi:hypothetical protein
MTLKIYKSSYKEQEAITIESKVLRVQFLPHNGSNMCSLYYKPKDLELLVQRKNKYKAGVYDGSYIKSECAGFDEMFPSIDECFYCDYPWKGIHIPDHGEVWSIPWNVNIENKRLHFLTYGVRFPYRIEKWVHFAHDNVIQINYKVTNLSAFDLDFMWAAHPMFILEEGSQILLPPQVNRVICTLDLTGGFGKYGDEFSWPIYEDSLGNKIDLSLIKPKIANRAIKYFIKGRMPEGWCGLNYGKSGLTMTLSFPMEEVPYLGILPNEGGWDDLYNIFLEPATAPLDRLDIAKIHGEHSTVRANSVYGLDLTISISDRCC